MSIWFGLTTGCDKRLVETGLQHLRLSICQDAFMCNRSFFLRKHLHRAFLHDDLHRCGSRGRRSRGAVTSSPSSASSFSSSSLASSPMRSGLVSLVITIISSLRDLTIPSRVAFSSLNLLHRASSCVIFWLDSSSRSPSSLTS
jgi:hypothetical protein